MRQDLERLDDRQSNLSQPMRHSWFQSQLTIHLLQAHLPEQMPVQVLESLEEQALPSMPVQVLKSLEEQAFLSKAKNSPRPV